MSNLTQRQEKWIERHNVGFNGPGMTFASFGPAYDGDCADCAEYDEYTGDEGGFSWSWCGICGCPLGGTRYVWHWVDDAGEPHHENDGCEDCLVFSANGEPPEDEHLSWVDDGDYRGKPTTANEQPTYKWWAIHFAKKIAKEFEQIGEGGFFGEVWCGHCGHYSDSGHDEFCVVPEAEKFLERENQS